MSWKTSLKLQTPYKTSARAFMPKYNHWTDFKGVCCWPHSDAHRRPRCSTCRRIERCLHYFAAATQHSCRQETSIRLMLWSTNEWSGVSMHWNAIKHNAEQSSCCMNTPYMYTKKPLRPHRPSNPIAVHSLRTPSCHCWLLRCFRQWQRQRCIGVIGSRGHAAASEFVDRSSGAAIVLSVHPPTIQTHCYTSLEDTIMSLLRCFRQWQRQRCIGVIG